MMDFLSLLSAICTAGLNAGKYPQPTEGGAGVSYYMPDASGEPNVVNYAGVGIKEESLGLAVAVTPEGLRKGTKAGKGGRRSDSGNKDMMQLKHEIQKIYTVYRPVSSADESTGSEKLISSSIPAIDHLIASTKAGLNAGKSPEPTKQGAGGSYYMHNASGDCVAVFKPLDEEPNAVNNPREVNEKSLGQVISVTGEGLRKGTKAGKGGIREAAAYLLDHPKSGRRSVSGETFGFAGVPPTTLVNFRSVYFNNPEGRVTFKLGSLQMYMENAGDCDEFGPSVFTVNDVHKIAVLDMRLANADRHPANILMSKSKDVLIPIDHGYCLPESFEDIRFDWLAWNQAKEPFTPATINYIEKLDAEEDIRLLKSYGWDMPLPTVRVLCISTMLLKEGAKRGLTPYTIGDIMCRYNPGKNPPVKKKKSVIEEIVEEALSLSGKDNDKFLKVVPGVMDSHLGRLPLPSDISLKIGTPS